MWTIRKNVSGRLWYTHNATGLKTHLKPTAAALSGFSGLPAGWDERKTPDGRTFYFNKRMGTSAWVKPANSLPDGWKELRTPDLVPFYVNEQLGLSTWDRPGQQPRQQTKQGKQVIVRRARPGQPNSGQNVGDNLLSATINAARLTGQGVEMASRQVGKLGKKKNWRKMGRMLNQVNSVTGNGSDSDGEYNDYNDDDGFGFGDDDSGGYQDQQQQGQLQQSFDFQQASFSEQPQQSFAFEDNQQQPMFQQPAYEQQQTFEYSVQSGQPAYEQPAFEQQPEQFSVTTEVSYSTGDPQQTYEQQDQYIQQFSTTTEVSYTTNEPQPGYGQQQDQYTQQSYEQQPAFESAPSQEPALTQQPTMFEPIQSPQQNDDLPPQMSQEPYMPPPQPTPQPQPIYQEFYTTQQVVYEPAQVPQQQVTVSYQVPTYTPEPTPEFTPQVQVQQPVYSVFMPNNQPEIITSDVPLVEVPGTPDNSNIFLGGGYESNDILAGTSLAAENNNVVSPQSNLVVPQDNIVVEVTIQQTPQPGLETVASTAPVVVQEYDGSAKPPSVVTVDNVQPEVDFNTGERCIALI
ncbi:hypothetical protein FSARC_5973 [Fusarium sarcochroum]|uniref:WW domain-containing protein n=1 Tax=Fusarium sarcochroum TaxID=1208366 RepID=A0A8H4TY87_9HYPO|nr:hypothetical protein FSARC_5973 [Fusarium sarcochroum]